MQARGVPVFAVNFGEIGFLATVEPEELEQWHRARAERRLRAAAPARDRARHAGGEARAINDVAIHRKVGERVAELALTLDGEDVG